jgi:hypothetical protein
MKSGKRNLGPISVSGSLAELAIAMDLGGITIVLGSRSRYVPAVEPSVPRSSVRMRAHLISPSRQDRTRANFKEALKVGGGRA